MTFPNSPYGQGFPDQPGFPQPSYTQQPSPPIFGHQPQPGYPGAGPAREPSSATGVTAATLAAFGAVAGLGTGVIAAMVIYVQANSPHVSGEILATAIIATLFNCAFAVLCGLGAIRLFERKTRGRSLVIWGCALSIASALLLYGVTAGEAESYALARGAYAGVGIVFPIVTLVLVLLPSTAAWIRAKPDPVVPQPHPQNPVAPQFHPPYPS